MNQFPVIYVLLVTRCLSPSIACTDDILAARPYPGVNQVSSIKSYKFRLSDGEEIFVEESGNPTGKPVIVLHGGPFDCRPSNHRSLFDPRRYHLIYFDQRGANKSKQAQFITKGNYLRLLVSDMEELRTHLKIEKWLVFASSWGGTVGLVYAESHPSRVSEMILRFPAIYPAAEIEQRKSQVPDLYAYNNHAQTPWFYLLQRNLFLKPDQISNNIAVVRSIPAFIIHGDRDTKVSVNDSRRLSEHWPNCKLKIVPGAEHEVYDDRIVAAIIEASDSLVDKSD